MWWGRTEHFGLEQTLCNLPRWRKFGQSLPSSCPHEVFSEVGFFFFFCRHNQAAGVTGEMSTAGKQWKEKAASTALVLIDIPAEESEYSNVSKLCYLTRESAEIRG